MAQMVKHLSKMWETWVLSLGWEDSLKKWQPAPVLLPWKSMDREAWGRLLSMGSQRESLSRYYQTKIKVQGPLLTSTDTKVGSSSLCLGEGNSSGYLHGFSTDSLGGLSSLLMGQGKIPESPPLTLSQQAWGGQPFIWGFGWNSRITAWSLLKPFWGIVSLTVFGMKVPILSLVFSATTLARVLRDLNTALLFWEYKHI